MRISISIIIMLFLGVNVYAQKKAVNADQRECSRMTEIFKKATTPKKLQEALDTFQKHYDVYSVRKSHVNGDATYSKWMIQYATLNEKLGNFAVADHAYTDMITELPDENVNKSTAYQNRIKVWLREGKYSEIIDLMSNQARQKHPATWFNSDTKSMWAEAYYNRNLNNDVDNALKLESELYEVHKSTKDSDYVRALNNLGLMCASFTGERLLTAYNYLVEGANCLQTKKDKDYYTVLSNLAYAEGKLGKFKDALSHINAAINWQSKTKNLPKKDNHYITSLWKKAMILYWQSQVDKNVKKTKVVDAFYKYFKAQKNYILSNFASMPEHERMSLWAAQYEPLSACYLVANEAPDFAYEVALFVKNLGMIGNKTMDKKFIQRLKMNANTIKSYIKNNDVAIEWIETEIVGDSTYVALALKKDGKVHFVPTIKERDLMNMPLQLNGTTMSFASALASQNSDDKEYIYNNKVLGDSIWGKVIKECNIKPNTNIYFAPTGLFNLFAIEYLPLGKACPEQGRRDTCNFYRLSSTGELAKSVAKSNTKSPMALLIGGVDYDDYTKESSSLNMPDRCGYETMRQKYPLGMNAVFTYLYGSGREVDSIYTKLDSTRTCLVKGERASEHFVKNNLNKYDIVHFATHGYSLDFDSGQILQRDSLMQDQLMMRTGIALAGANVAGQEDTHAEDGILTAKEISQMDLSHVKLVVLSACQTAVAKMTDEEVASLSRAFKKAGAGAMIVSLWKVDDSATAALMMFLYDNLRDGMSVHDAFYSARNKLRSTKVTTSYTRSIKRRRISKSLNKSGYTDAFILIDAN